MVQELSLKWTGSENSSVPILPSSVAPKILWMRISGSMFIEEKLGLIECEPHEKVLFAAHQLHDAPGAWWRNFKASHPADYRFTWEEFRTAFRSFHIPKGIMDIKKKEFLNLTQGGCSCIRGLGSQPTCKGSLLFMCRRIFTLFFLKKMWQFFFSC